MPDDILKLLGEPSKMKHEQCLKILKHLYEHQQATDLQKEPAFRFTNYVTKSGELVSGAERKLVPTLPDHPESETIEVVPEASMSNDGNKAKAPVQDKGKGKAKPKDQGKGPTTSPAKQKSTKKPAPKPKPRASGKGKGRRIAKKVETEESASESGEEDESDDLELASDSGDSDDELDGFLEDFGGEHGLLDFDQGWEMGETDSGDTDPQEVEDNSIPMEEVPLEVEQMDSGEVSPEQNDKHSGERTYDPSGTKVCQDDNLHLHRQQDTHASMDIQPRHCGEVTHPESGSLDIEKGRHPITDSVQHSGKMRDLGKTQEDEGAEYDRESKEFDSLAANFLSNSVKLGDLHPDLQAHLLNAAHSPNPEVRKTLLDRSNPNLHSAIDSLLLGGKGIPSTASRHASTLPGKLQRKSATPLTVPDKIDIRRSPLNVPAPPVTMMAFSSYPGIHKEETMPCQPHLPSGSSNLSTGPQSIYIPKTKSSETGAVSTQMRFKSEQGVKAECKTLPQPESSVTFKTETGPKSRKPRTSKRSHEELTGSEHNHVDDSGPSSAPVKKKSRGDPPPFPAPTGPRKRTQNWKRNS